MLPIPLGTLRRGCGRDLTLSAAAPLPSQEARGVVPTGRVSRRALQQQLGFGDGAVERQGRGRPAFKLYRDSQPFLGVFLCTQSRGAKKKLVEASSSQSFGAHARTHPRTRRQAWVLPQTRAHAALSAAADFARQACRECAGSRRRGSSCTETDAGAAASNTISQPAKKCPGPS